MVQFPSCMWLSSLLLLLRKFSIDSNFTCPLKLLILYLTRKQKAMSTTPLGPAQASTSRTVQSSKRVAAPEDNLEGGVGSTSSPLTVSQLQQRRAVCAWWTSSFETSLCLVSPSCPLPYRRSRTCTVSPTPSSLSWTQLYKAYKMQFCP